MTLKHFGLMLVAGVILVGAACSTDDDGDGSNTLADATTEPQTQQPPGDDLVSAGGGPGISVDDARRSTLDEPLLVNGYVFLVEGRLRLCGAIAESFPPQCGGDSIDLIDFDEGDFSFETASGVSWTAEPVQVLGLVEEGTMRPAGTVSAGEGTVVSQ